MGKLSTNAFVLKSCNFAQCILADRDVITFARPTLDAINLGRAGHLEHFG